MYDFKLTNKPRKGYNLWSQINTHKRENDGHDR